MYCNLSVLTGVNFAFARSYGSNMVLQRAPVRARIWGYGFNVGDTVTVSISGGGEYQTVTTEGTFILVLLYLSDLFIFLWL